MVVELEKKKQMVNCALNAKVITAVFIVGQYVGWRGMSSQMVLSWTLETQLKWLTYREAAKAQVPERVFSEYLHGMLKV